MHPHDISNAGAAESGHYRAIERDESRRRAHDQMSDSLRDDMTWDRLEEIMACAPLAQRKAFWTQHLGLLDVQASLICKQNVSMIAEPLQDAVALAIDDQATKELAR
jgi:hypothetical protein